MSAKLFLSGAFVVVTMMTCSSAPGAAVLVVEDVVVVGRAFGIAVEAVCDGIEDLAPPHAASTNAREMDNKHHRTFRAKEHCMHTL